MIVLSFYHCCYYYVILPCFTHWLTSTSPGSLPRWQESIGTSPSWELTFSVLSLHMRLKLTYSSNAISCVLLSSNLSCSHTPGFTRDTHTVLLCKLHGTSTMPALRLSTQGISFGTHVPKNSPHSMPKKGLVRWVISLPVLRDDKFTSRKARQSSIPLATWSTYAAL